jgi:hypothetical protein
MKRIVVSLALFCAACTATSDLPKEEIVLRGPAKQEIRVQAEIAGTPEARTQGLMSRTELPEGTGMLFVMPPEQAVLTFWMKDTLIPLDILFFDEKGKFVSWAGMTPCEADPCSTYTSAGPAQYALEVPAGFVEKENVGTGWVLVGFGN